MSRSEDLSRRVLLRRLVLGLSLLPTAMARAGETGSAGAQLLSEADPAAKALHYVEDAARAQGAESGANCSNCSLYGAASGADQGTCTLFPGKQVKAAGWCTGWSGL